MIQPIMIKKQRIALFILLMLIVLTVIIGIGIGYSPLPYSRIIPTIFGHGTFKEEFILLSIRMPRIFITLLAGMALALSGTILQALTRNDLADPGIIGINSGAGVAITIFFLFIPIEPGAFTYILPIVAFIGALLSATLIYILSFRKNEGVNPVKLILIGIGFSFALSGVMILLITSADRTKVDFIVKWLAGSIWGTDWPFLWALLPWLIILIPFVLFKANHLNLLRLSEPLSINLGISIEKERITLLIAAVGLAASAVSVTGGISFIGLMSPHIARALVGARHQLFIPISILIGGWLLLIADIIGHNILSPNGIPAGTIVALIGAPYFIYLLLKR